MWIAGSSRAKLRQSTDRDLASSSILLAFYSNCLLPGKKRRDKKILPKSLQILNSISSREALLLSRKILDRNK
jgi:urease accessory protein UreH